VARLRHLLLAEPVGQRGRQRDLQTHLAASFEPEKAGGIGSTTVNGDLTGGRDELGDASWRGNIFLDPTPVTNLPILATPMVEG
jgi:hypothetical protein